MPRQWSMCAAMAAVLLATKALVTASGSRDISQWIVGEPTSLKPIQSRVPVNDRICGNQFYDPLQVCWNYNVLSGPSLIIRAVHVLR
jgi:hypothetical protein